MHTLIYRLTLLPILCLYVLPTSARTDEGMASYYADRFHAAPTSTGETYDKQAFTAASKDYPYGTVLEVTEVVTGKTVEVRVNDCGPHHPDRIIDLSRAVGKVHRVFAGKFYFQDEARQLRNQVREAGFRDAAVRRVQ